LISLRWLGGFTNGIQLYSLVSAVEPPALPVVQLEQIGVAQQIEQLRSSILSKTDATRELQLKLRTTCVPLSVCTYLSQCIKDVEVRAVDVSFTTLRDMTEINCVVFSHSVIIFVNLHYCLIQLDKNSLIVAKQFCAYWLITSICHCYL